MKTYKISLKDVHLRLDHFLTEELKDLSRSRIQQLIKEGFIKVNQTIVKNGYKLVLNDMVEVNIPEAKAMDIEAVDLALKVVYEDEDIIVIDKPKGLVVHPAKSHQSHTLVHGLLHQVAHLSGINGIIRPGIVHRIDKDTTGLLVVAKNDESHQFLANQLKNHEIKRTYLALVHGVVKENQGYIEAPIGRHPKNRLKMAIIDGGKQAITHFNVLERFEHNSLLELELETGRTHQIRVHLEYIKFPIVGDPLYGKKNDTFKEGQFLHAKQLVLIHPRKKVQMTFEAALHENFSTYLNHLRQDFVL
jgi:23S rRNA pseudouridine1911/1915/1917 synthase